MISLVHSFWKEESDRLLDRMQDAGVRVRVLQRKDGYEKWYERAATRLAKLFNPSIEEKFASVFFDGAEARIYMPLDSNLTEDSVDMHALLRHECVHVLQAQRLAKGRLGAFLFKLAYLLVLPAWVTLRAKYEEEAYLESARVWHTALAPLQDDKLWTSFMTGLCSQWEVLFYGPAYFWMDPRNAGGFAPGGINRTLVTSRRQLFASPLNEVGFYPRTFPVPGSAHPLEVS